MTGIAIKQTKRGDIIIRIPAPILRSATNQHPELDDGERQTVVRNTKRFSDDVLVELDTDNGDDGLTPIQRMLDDAILAAVENGSDAVRTVGEED